MVRREIGYKGKTIEELKAMDLQSFAALAPSRIRRSIKRGFTAEEKTLLQLIAEKHKGIKTHCRDIVIVPSMVDAEIRVYSGREFIPVIVTAEMLGHRLGEFVLTRKKVGHNAPGIGATRSSASMSVK